MFPKSLCCLLGFVSFSSHVWAKLPDTYKHGTSIGGWLLSEPWMNPVEWAAMGGESCPADSSSCAASEWSLARKLGQKRANEAFLKHWQSWFTQSHITKLKQLKLDHVRIPMGFWIVEELVEPPAELYAQGGWMELKRGLRQLHEAGFHVTLDMHALPGVSASNQMFAGNVTSDVQFYIDHNYQRALTWSAILTSMTHLDPDFSSVVAILCINEPLSDASLTPGLEQYYTDFVTVTRAVEYAMGVECEVDLKSSVDRLSKSRNGLLALRAAIPLIPIYAAKAKVALDPQVLAKLKQFTSGPPTGVTTAPPPVKTGTVPLKRSSSHPASSPSSTKHLKRQLYPKRGLNSPLKRSNHGSLNSCLATMAMPKRWQWKGDGASMANHTLGPAAYEDHMYFAYGGVADPNLKSYLSTICNSKYYQSAKEIGEVPYGHGEFSLATNFNATDDDLRAWGDAQRYVYNQEKFWTFWTFRLGAKSGKSEPALTQSFINQWSYLEAVEAGIWPKDPSAYYNPSVCQPYLNQ